MKITLVCYVFPPEHCPAGVMVSELAEDLAARGHKITVITGWPNHPYGALFSGFRRRWRHESSHFGYKLIRIWHAILPQKSIPKRILVYLTFAVSSFINGLFLERQDIVLDISPPFFGPWASLTLARLWKARFVRVIMDILPEAAANSSMLKQTSILYKILRCIETWNCKRCDKVVTIGEGLKKLLCNRGIEPEHIKTLPLWIDTHKVQPMPRNNAWRQEHDISPDQFVALLAGTIGYASGAQILLETAAALQDRTDILLLVVGEGPVKDTMENTARQQQLKNIRFLPFQPPDRLAEMQSAADVGIVTLLPSAGSSSLPSKTLGYMAAGRAVVASADEDTDLVQIIRKAGCGLTAPPQNAESLANSIRMLADDRQLCEKLGQQARKYLYENFSRASVIAQYELLLKDCKRI